MPPPKSLRKAERGGFVWKRPDADKLARAVLDALEGVVYQQDAQVAHLEVSKLYALPTERTGVGVMVLDGLGPPLLGGRPHQGGQ